MMSAQMSGSHIQTPILTSRLPGKWSYGLRAVGLIVACAVVGWMTYLTLRAGITSFEIREYRFGLTSVPVWPAKLMIPLGSAGLLAALLFQLITNVRQLWNGAESRTHMP